MSIDIITFAFIVSLVIYVPFALSLLYVWWKYGKGERLVLLARFAFLFGSALIIFYMTSI